MTAAPHPPRIWMLTPVAEADRAFFLSQLALQAAQFDDPAGLRVIAVLQSENPGDAEALAAESRETVPSAEVLHLTEPSVSRARNLALSRCLAKAGAEDFVIFRDCRSILDQWFIASLCQAGPKTDLARTADIRWSTTLPDAPAAAPPAEDHVDLIGKPTIGAFAFRPALLSKVRFREDLGPGWATRIKAGEDVLFMADLLAERGDWRIPALEGALILAPRGDTNAKRALYASGQVYAARALMADTRLPAAVRKQARFRLWLFTIGTLRFLRPGTWRVFRARIKALGPANRP